MQRAEGALWDYAEKPPTPGQTPGPPPRVTLYVASYNTNALRFYQNLNYELVSSAGPDPGPGGRRHRRQRPKRIPTQRMHKQLSRP